MVEAKEARIGDNTYRISHLPPKKSIRTLVRIMKTVVSPMMRGLSGSDEKKKSILDVDIGFDKIADGLAASLDEDTVIDIIESLLEYVELKKSGGFAAISLEVDFQGNLSELFEVVKESLILNYGDVLKKNLKLVSITDLKNVSTGKKSRKN